MKHATRALSLAVVVGALAVPAAASAGTQVNITSWKVQTSDGKVHKLSPGDTFKACASHPAVELKARSKVQGAQKGKSYSAVWTANGKPYAKFSETWRKSGSFRFTFGIGAEGFQPARYQLKLVENSKSIGAGTITLKTKKGC